MGPQDCKRLQFSSLGERLTVLSLCCKFRPRSMESYAHDFDSCHFQAVCVSMGRFISPLSFCVCVCVCKIGIVIVV